MLLYLLEEFWDAEEENHLTSLETLFYRKTSILLLNVSLKTDDGLSQ